MFNNRLCCVRRVVENTFGIINCTYHLYFAQFFKRWYSHTDYFEYIEQELDLNALESSIYDARRGSTEALEVKNKFISGFIQNQLYVLSSIFIHIIIAV